MTTDNDMLDDVKSMVETLEADTYYGPYELWYFPEDPDDAERFLRTMAKAFPSQPVLDVDKARKG